MMNDPKALKRENRELKSHLRALTEVTDKFLVMLDAEMNKPSSNERGRRIAKMCNYLNINNDAAKHFGLKVPLKELRLDDSEKNVAEVMAAVEAFHQAVTPEPKPIATAESLNACYDMTMGAIRNFNAVKGKETT